MKIKTVDLYDVNIPYLKQLFIQSEYPWEMLPKIKDYIKALLSSGIEGFALLKEGVLVGEGVKIHPSAVIEAPAIIGKGTEIRPNAYLRGNVITGENCVIGNSTEIKNAVLLNGVQVPHYNYVGDSVLGNFAHMGAGAVCSNLKSDKKDVIIRGKDNIKTGIRKIGGFLADYADIGCGCVVNPGTIVGKNTAVYPLTSLRGVIQSGMIVKSMNNIVKRV